MNRIGVRWLAIGLIVVLGRGAVGAQDAAQDEAMKKWKEFMTPGENHKLLKFKEGNWEAKVKMWMKPGDPPMESPAESETKMIMDGRYLFDKVKGTFNGMPFEGLGTTAYDNGRKKFVATWIDNMGTGIMIGEGDYDASKKTWKYTAKSTEPASGQSILTRSVERIVDDNTWVMEMYGPGPDGNEFQMMEITYHRKTK